MQPIAYVEPLKRTFPPPPYLQLSEEVADALQRGRPVVALESTLVAHGLPWPDNLEIAQAITEVVRRAGVVPAMVAVIGGKLCVGLDEGTLERLARGHFIKTGMADLGPLVASGGDGATTVSATVFAAARAGIPLFATGGIGGVHRGDAMDVSSDLMALASEPVAVISAGAKAILDLPRTLEYLETLGVPVIGYRTSEMPAFYSRTSGRPPAHRVDTPEQAAELLLAHFAVHSRRGILLANPIPAQDALDEQLINRALEAALRSAGESRVVGKQLTPFLLNAIAKETGRQSLRANRALVLSNASVAAEIALALQAQRAIARAGA